MAFTLWLDQNEEDALALLRRALSELRAALPQDERWIESTRETIFWNPTADCWIDTDEYKRHIQQATLADLMSAVDLYRADLLLNIDDEWVLPERERCRQMQIGALRHLSAHFRLLNNFPAALSFTGRAMALDPLSEILYRDWIGLHYLSGDRAAALAEYGRLQTILAEELDVAPMAETRALVEAISQGLPLPHFEVEPSPAAQGLLATPPPLPIAPKLVGREIESARLAELWKVAVDGRGGLAVVSGEAGVGKSHLTHSLTSQVVQSGGLPLVGYSFEFEGSLPYQPIVEMLRAVAPALMMPDLPSAYRSALARLLPDVFRVAGVQAALLPDNGDANTHRALLFEAFLHSFRFLSRKQPLLLVFEDVHWADHSTLDWLTYVVPRLSDTHIFVLLTYRTDAVSAQHALARLERRFERDGTLTKIPIRPLTRQDCQELVALLSGLEEPVLLPVANQLWIETGGNPYFLHEIVCGLLETGQIAVTAGRWSGAFIEDAPVAELPLPDSLRETINARVERLADMVGAFLKLAAVAGQAFQFQTVQHAGGWESEPALNALETLLARGFLREHERIGTYAFAHHLVQEAIYSGLVGPRRAYFHLRIAEELQALHPDDFESLAYHFARAGQGETARIYSLRAAERARQLLAMKDAAEHYHTALALWPEADPAGRAETLYRLGHCQWVSAETDRALETFQAARALFEQLGEWVKAGDSERVIGRLYWETGERATALLHHRRALALLEGAPESAELGRALSSISQMHLVAGEYDQAVSWGERALALAERLEAEDVTVHALNNIGSARIRVHEFDPPRGLDLLRDSLRRALVLGLAHDTCRAYFNLGEDLVGLCRYDEARAVFEELYVYSERVQAQIFQGGALRRLAALDWSCGRWTEVLDRWPALLKSSTGIWGVWAGRLVGRIYIDLGQIEMARLELERTLPRILKWGEVQIIVPHLEQLARAYAAQGAEAEADQTVQQFLDLIDRSPYLDWSCTMPVIFACSWFATRPQTLPAARACLPRLERAHHQFRTRESEAALAEGQAIIASAEGALPAATHHFRQAAAAWEALGRPYDQARALKGLGYALHARQTQHPQAGPADSDSSAARLALGRALAILDSLAAQVSNSSLKTSFLGSELYQQIRGLMWTLAD